MNRTARHTNPIRIAVAASALLLGAGAMQTPADAAGSGPGGTTTTHDASTAVAELDWTTVINNNDLVPPLAERNFNSYNQPSVNLDGRVVVRARSRGGPQGPPTHGIYTRDMAVGGPIVSVLDRTSPVPSPNNLGTTFIETPSFPRIDMATDTIATRGNHRPVWRHLLDDGTETQVGTTGIYTNPFGSLITGASKLGGVPEFGYFEVPGLPGVPFDVFPGSPAVTDRSTIVFKGNYTQGGLGRTGVYFRDLADGPAGGTSPVVRIADSTETLIPGTDTVFGSTAPPSAAGEHMVFAGFDDEDAPTLGGIYLAPLRAEPPLTTLVGIGDRIPGGSRADTFDHIGEGLAFDGRFVAFWGAWGDETTTVRLYCPTEGNQDRIDFCNQVLVCGDTGLTLGAPGITCDETGCYREVQVPVHQGIFVHDIETRTTRRVATADGQFDDFLFWNFSGKTPCVGRGHAEEGSEDDGEPARWRAAAFVALAGGPGATYQTVFKARTGELVGGTYQDPVDGIYLRRGPGHGQAVEVVLDTTMDGQLLDPEAPVGSRIMELGLEREGLRGDWLAISAKMGIAGGEEADGMAGVYATRLAPR
jgi:hypothetical protein